MFGTEIKLSTFIFLCVETIIFFFQLSNYISRIQDPSRIRFLCLILAFICYNICSGFLPDRNIPIHLLIQNILAFGSGIVLASYYFYYLVKELNISQEKLFNVRVLFWSLVASFLIGYVLTYLVSGSFKMSKKIFIILPVLISIYFCISTVRFLAKKRKKHRTKTPYRLMVYSGYIGIIFMATMPIVVFFGDYQVINNTLVNISFFLAFYAYQNYYIYQCKIENEFLLKSGFFDKTTDSILDHKKLNDSLLNYGLSPRELEVAYLMLKKLNYQAISEEMYISSKTVSKHASNIFKKTNCENRREFIQKFKLINQGDSV